MLPHAAHPVTILRIRSKLKVAIVNMTKSSTFYSEVSTTLSKDGRSRPPHLRPWRDGWLHLRFMLLFNPRWLFIVPGAVLALVSLVIWLILLQGPMRVGGVVFDLHTLLFAEAGVVLGGIFLSMGIAMRLFGAREGLLRGHPLLDRLRNSAVLEIGSTAGFVSMFLGLISGAMAFSGWATTGFGALVPGDVIRQVSISTLFFMLGGLVMSTSLLLGFLALPMAMNGAALLLLRVLFSAGASWFLKIGAVGVIGRDNLLAMATNPMIMLGGLCYVLAFVSYVIVLQKVQLSLAQPVITAGASVITVVVSTLLLKEVMSSANWLGLILICGGVYLMFMGRA